MGQLGLVELYIVGVLLCSGSILLTLMVVTVYAAVRDRARQSS